MANIDIEMNFRVKLHQDKMSRQEWKSFQAVQVPFQMRITNNNEDKQVRLREAYVRISTSHWEYTLPVFFIFNAEAPQELDRYIEPLGDTGWMNAITAVPLTSATFHGQLHPRRTKVRLVIRRVGGVVRTVSKVIPPETWWQSTVVPEVEAEVNGCEDE